MPEFQDANIDADAAVGVCVAVDARPRRLVVIAIVLGVLVLRRSNVARILLVISSAVVALLSLLAIASGVSAVTLIAAVATIVLLFVGGAGDWFKRAATPAATGGGYPGGHTATAYGQLSGQPTAAAVRSPTARPVGQTPTASRPRPEPLRPAAAGDGHRPPADGLPADR